MQPSPAIKILFTGGGTLGPVTPLLAAVPALRELEPNAEFAWIGTSAGPERTLVEQADIPFHAIPAGKLRRYFSWRNLADVFLVVAGFVRAFMLLGRLRPRAVVSAGGFVAVPVAYAAWLRGIPVHVHQQDVIPGLANRLCLPVAASVSVALESSLTDFASKQPVWTGNPVRPELHAGTRQEAARIFGLEPGVPVLLVLGGGTGAAGINDLVRGALPELLRAAQVIHVAGRGKTSGVARVPRYHERELLTSEMAHAYAAADLVVTRAGMGTLTELAALGKPALIVPMPASHQEANARAFARTGAGLILDERHVSATRFALTALGLLKDPHRLTDVAAAMRGMNRTTAAHDLAALIVRAAYGKAGRH